MRTKFTINEFLFNAYLFCAVSSGIIKCVIGKWIPIYDTYTFLSQGWVSSLLYNISILILFVLILRCNFRYQKRNPKIVQGINIIIIFYYLIWTIISLINNSMKDVIFGGISTSVILLIIICPLGYDPKIWEILKKKIIIINFIYLIIFFALVLIFWRDFGLIWPTYASYKGIFTYWITSSWLLNFIFNNGERLKKIININNCLLVVASFIMQSRAWVLQSLVLLFISLLNKGKKNRLLKLILGVLLLCILVVCISYIFPDVVGNLFNRGLEDTRSGQYEVFFSQHNIQNLFFGLGLNATYKYLGNDFYPYFDNQFMFIMFHYGIIPVLSWLCIYISLFKKYKNINYDDLKMLNAARYVGTFVLMAYLGISTYYQVEIGYSSVVVMILFGNAISRIYKRR